MNQNAHTLQLSSFLTNLEGWGRRGGEAARHKLAQRLDTRPDGETVRLSMSGVRRLDMTFAQIAIAGLIRDNLGKRAICLVDLADQDILDNVTAAAERARVPVTIWNGVHVHVAGPCLTAAGSEALAFALAAPTVRAAEFAEAAGISIANASTRFKTLADQGCLLRHDGLAASGGAEYLYSRIG